MHYSVLVIGENVEEKLAPFHYLECTGVDRTNPNKMWDWYQIGGRWPRMLKLKPGAKTDSLSYGDRSFLLRNDPIKIGYVDSARICDIDFDGMRSDQEKSCSEDWDKAQSLRGDDKQNFMWECSIRVDDTKESYTKRLSTFSTYYVLHNGEWLEFEDEEAKYKIMDLINSLDTETRITVVDIHI